MWYDVMALFVQADYCCSRFSKEIERQNRQQFFKMDSKLKTFHSPLIQNNALLQGLPQDLIKRYG